MFLELRTEQRNCRSSNIISSITLVPVAVIASIFTFIDTTSPFSPLESIVDNQLLIRWYNQKG
jgi:hypothetical protein